MKFGWRLAGLGATFAAMFVILFTRLWFVQVAAGAEYAARAADQQIDSVPTLAPRGDIRDRNGVLLATSTFEPALVVDRRQVPSEEEAELVQRLSGLLDVQAADIEAAFEAAGPQGRFNLAEVDKATAHYVWLHSANFPGVEVEMVPVRVYTRGTLMAHVLGHVGKPSQDDIDANPARDRRAVVGKAGIERQYEDELEGKPGVLAHRIDARGQILEFAGEVKPDQGNTLWLTLDSRVQQVVEETLAAGIRLSNDLKESGGEYANRTQRGAVVVLDATDFSIVAMVSEPAFDPQEFVAGISSERFEELGEAQAFNNLAVQGLFQPASTFKAVTYVTAVEENLYPAEAESHFGQLNCTGSLTFGFDDASRQVHRDWTYPRGHGAVDLHEATSQSCNVYFWSVALRIWRDSKTGAVDENILQEWARALGYGEPTGIDLPFEAGGIVPDRALFEEWAENDDPRLDARRLELPSPWLGGDLMNLAVGQGAMLATPLQVATSYGAIVNGGKLWQPRVVERIQARNGTVTRQRPVLVRDIDLDPETVAWFREDLVRVTTAGTARRAFADFGSLRWQVGGKTGTSQSTNKELHDNTAWFVGVAPMDQPRYVVVVVIDEGGSGGQVAAPVAARILQYLLGERMTPVRPGEATN